MNKHIKNILKNKDPELSLLENISYYVSENSEIDIHDIADIIKNDKTCLTILMNECFKKKLLKHKPNKFINIIDLFK